MFDRDLLIRLALGLPCLALGFWLVQREPDPYLGIFGALPCLFAFGRILYPSSTTVAARTWGSFFLPQEDARPSPAVSRAQQLRVHERFEESLAEYERLLLEFPQDLDLWAACFEIAWVDLHDRELAVELHRRSLRATCDAEQWKKLNYRYLVHAHRHPEAGDWEDAERIAVERRTAFRARSECPQFRRRK